MVAIQTNVLHIANIVEESVVDGPGYGMLYLYKGVLVHVLDAIILIHIHIKEED